MVDATKEQIESMYAGGMTQADIAKEFGTRQSAIAKLMRKYGLKADAIRKRKCTCAWDGRFWAKVDVRGEDECWPWKAGTNQDGYGRFRAEGKKRQAHHVAYFLKHGKWPEYLLHSCDNPPCCNERHLSEGTHQRNMDECWNKGRGRAFKNTHLVPRIQEMIAAGVRNRDICRELGVKNDAVSRIRHGQIYGPTSRAVKIYVQRQAA